MEICWSVSRFFPHVAILSLQQRLSVAVCVAQWLINMCPSRSMSPASEGLQTNTPTHILDSRNIFLSLLSPPLPSLPLIPFPPFHFDGWWCVQSCGPTVLSWCEPNPSGTQYPVYQLSALWKPQQYWAEAEVQNSLQFVQVMAKVEVLSFSVTLPCCLKKLLFLAFLSFFSSICTCFHAMLCEQISQQTHLKTFR